VIQQLAPPKISSDQIHELAQNGFVVFDRFLDTQAIKDLVAAVESLKDDPQSSRTRRGAPFARRNLLELSFVRELISRQRVRGLVDAIVPGLTAVRAILFDKCQSANWTVPWHQDRSIAVRQRIDLDGFGPWSTKAGVVHVQPPFDILRQMLTLRFHLDPSGVDNGPLRVIAKTQNRILDQKEIEIAVAEGKQTLCATGIGGVVVMRPLILHASSPATNPSHRRVIHIEFGPPSLPNGLHWAMA
jgi:hypothetical protein